MAKTTKKRASEDALGALHQALAAHFITALEGGEIDATKLGVIVRFLRDNGITSVPEDNNALQELIDKLSPEHVDDETYEEVKRKTMEQYQ